MSRRPRRDGFRDRLFDLVMTHPDGVTVEDIMAHLEVDHSRANQAIHDLRLWLTENENTVFLVCNRPAHGSGRHLYTLASKPDDLRPYSTNRRRDLYSRSVMFHAMWAASFRGATPGTEDYQVAEYMEVMTRTMLMTLDRMLKGNPNQGTLGI